MATISELLEAAKTKLATVLDGNPEDYVDYTVGDKTFKRSQYVAMLQETIRKLSAEEVADADIAFIQFDDDISACGEDKTQYTVL